MSFVKYFSVYIISILSISAVFLNSCSSDDNANGESSTNEPVLETILISSDFLSIESGNTVTFSAVTNLGTDVTDDVVFSVGYMKVINRKLINKHNIINLHPSLLPKYKGLMTQKRMLINNEKEFGFTIHKVSAELDAGDIICQKRKKITNFDEQKILRAHKELEHKFVFKELVNYLN